jgi:hypothetical protein
MELRGIVKRLEAATQGSADRSTTVHQRTTGARPIPAQCRSQAFAISPQNMRTGEPVSSGRALQVGFWAAISTAVCAAVFAVAGVGTPARSGPFCRDACVQAPYVNVAQFIPGDYLWLIPGILLAPIFIVLVACIHGYATERNKTFSLIALSFAVIYTVVIVVNYFIQLTVVIPSLQSGETQGLSLFTQYNPHGFFIALEVLAYLMMSAAFLAAAPVFAGGRVERTIRWLFALSFVLAATVFVGFWLLRHDLVTVEVSVLIINWLVLIIGGTLLSIVFRRAGRA